MKSDEDTLYSKYPTEREPDEHVVARGKVFFKWLAAREEKNIVCVTHSAFLRALFRNAFDNMVTK